MNQNSSQNSGAEKTTPSGHRNSSGLDKEQLKANLISGSFWLRFLHMIVVGVVLYAILYVFAIVVVIQFFFALITGEDNIHLRSFAKSMCAYIAESVKFLSFVSEEYPFPFREWPSGDE